MFAHLRGQVDSLGSDHAVIDVQGVGYFVYASKNTLSQLNVHKNVKLLIETLMRQESLTLFGFFSEAEKTWFNLLLSVQGVGPKVALGILGSMTLDELASALVHQDKAMISRGDGVGPKLAGRILLELKDKCKNMVTFLGEGESASMPFTGDVKKASNAAEDALSALQNLGYSLAEAKNSLSHIEGAETMDSATLIRLCLQHMRTRVG